MAKTANIFVLAATAALTATVVSAQSTTFTNADTAADQLEDLQDTIEDEAERDNFDFGNEGRSTGTYGSVAFRLSDSDVGVGNDTTELGLGVNYGFYDGVNGSELNLVYAYNETNGVEDKNTLALGYDYTRDINAKLFGYGAIDLAYDNLATGTSIYRDGLVGFGVGYRVVSSDTTDWAVKVGPGYRYIEFGDNTDAKEAAYSVESNLSYKFSDTVLLTNDTRLIGSDSDTSVVNDLAVSVSMTDTLALRTSYTSKYNGADFGALEKDENLLGVAVVYSF